MESSVITAVCTTLNQGVRERSGTLLGVGPWFQFPVILWLYLNNPPPKTESYLKVQRLTFCFPYAVKFSILSPAIAPGS
jgi:hypothetical protein